LDSSKPEIAVLLMPKVVVLLYPLLEAVTVKFQSVVACVKGA
jgi:hypothetical protein